MSAHSLKFKPISQKALQSGQVLPQPKEFSFFETSTFLNTSFLYSSQKMQDLNIFWVDKKGQLPQESSWIKKCKKNFKGNVLVPSHRIIVL